MKKLLYLFAILFALPLTSTASHVVGGDVSWRCLANGKYVFFMSVYRDCSGIQWNFQNETLNIYGSPLPTNGISSIVMKPDSNRLVNSNNGDTSPECTSSYGVNYSCANGDPGSIQAFHYQSDPVTLTGVPPTNGWNFLWNSPCCRSNMTNLNASGTSVLLRAIMFPTASNDSVDVCFDSSPTFADLPQTVLCRSSLQSYKHVMEDAEGDSISYAWSQPYTTPQSNPQPVPYATGYSASNPTPGTSQNSANVSSTLNSETGDISFAVYSGVGNEKFAKVIEVSNWRNGKIISKVFREIPFTITNCPPLPSGNTNNLPILSLPISQDNFGVYRDTVIAGTFIDYLVNLSDLDSVGIASSNVQDITLIPFGSSYTINYALGGPCSNTSQSSCAYLQPAPVLNVNNSPPNYEFNGIGAIGTRFKWQTDCSDLGDSLSPKTHYFTFKYFDDHCPVPQIAYKTMAITILPSSQPCSVLTSILSAASFQEEVRLFPNPSTGRVIISLGKELHKTEVQVRNIRGQLISRNQYTNQSQLELEIDGESGIYFIQVINEFGDSANLKVVKQ